MNIFNCSSCTQVIYNVQEKVVDLLVGLRNRVILVAAAALNLLAAYFSSLKALWLFGPFIPLSKQNWKVILIDQNASKIEAQRLKGNYEKLNIRANGYDHSLGTVHGSMPANFGMWMPGVALIASYLSKKNSVEGIYVCKTLEAFATRLHEIARQKEDCREALIIGTVQSGLTRYGYQIQPNFPQHKMAVFVEKKEGRLSIAVLDSQPLPGHNSELNPMHMDQSLWEGFDEPNAFSPLDLVFRAILIGLQRSSQLPVRMMHSQVMRQKKYGCAEFALLDALAYLRNPSFFDKVVCSKQMTNLNNHQVESIVELPPEFMIGLQGAEEKEAYEKKRDMSQTLLGKKKSLQEYFQEHVLETPDGKKQNLYITKKHFFYLARVVTMLKTFDKTQIQALWDKTLLTHSDEALFPQMLGEIGPTSIIRKLEIIAPAENFILIE